MTQREEMAEGCRKWQALLMDDEAFEDVTRERPGFFSAALQDRLTQVYMRHGRHETDRGQSGDEEKGAEDETTLVKSGASARTKRHPWTAFLKLKLLTMDPWVQKHLESHGSRPEKFLDDRHLLIIDSAALKGNVISDAFGACYEYTTKLDRRIACDRFRWLFMMLFFFDLANLINPSSRAANSTGRYGSIMTKDVKRFFGPTLSHQGLDEQQLNRQLNRYSKMGRHLHLLSDRLGPGCLFFLGEQLTDYFLLKQFANTGPLQAEAVDHLSKLGLHTLAEESGANKLASSIRGLAYQSFRKALQNRET